MVGRDSIRNKIFTISSYRDFEDACLETFRYQYKFNTIYRKFCDLMGSTPRSAGSLPDIPFLPIEFFRDHRVVTGNAENFPLVFESSGTTEMRTSRHFVAEPELYRESFTRGFTQFFGKPGDFVFLALLPSYLERESSSLVYMVDHFIKKTKSKGSGFYLHDHRALVQKIEELKKEDFRIILFGVSFALLDLAEGIGPDLQGVTVIETGGMKGRRREITREELHERLEAGLNIDGVCSEYGMTELLSQAYSTGDGIFDTVPWMKVLVRDINDPLTSLEEGDTGGINVIDLANIDSCCFIATQDLGRLHPDGRFEVMGRFDNSDLRGCNLMI